MLVTQLCLTLCDPMDYSLPGSSVHGILQARILEWVAMTSSRGLPDPGIEPRSPILQVDSLLSESPGKPWIFFWLENLGIRIAWFYSRSCSSLSTYFPNSACWQNTFSLLKIWFHRVLVATHGIFIAIGKTLSCSMWDLVPWPRLLPFLVQIFPYFTICK